MTETKVVEASMAVAIATKLCRPAVIPMYPITPQTHIVERLADFINDGELDSEMIHVESEHSAISAAIGSAAMGVRTFTATASQGLALMHEIIFIVSSLRYPIVMAVANRALSGPINIWNDHQDSVSARDSGWIQLYVESSQEAFDTTIQAFKIGETQEVSLPVMVCLDGFTLSHVYEPVELLNQEQVDGFLPAYKPSIPVLDPAKPVSIGPIAYPDSYMEFKKAEDDAMQKALKIIRDVNSEYSKSFGRRYGDGLVELYRMKDAKHAVVAMGSICGTSRVAVDEMRKKGKKVGLIKIKAFRPFPKAVIRKVTEGLKGIAVLDRNISIGFGGALCSEIRSALSGKKIIVNSFIAGLGGRDVTKQHVTKALNSLDKKRDTQWLL